LSTKEKNEIIEAIKQNDLAKVAERCREHPRRLRYLITVLYEPEATLRQRAARCLADASSVHPVMVRKLIARLVWAMTNESHTYLPNAPEAMLAVAEVNPALVAPFSADLIRLSADASLNAGLCDTLRRIAAHCPGIIEQRMTRSLGKKIKYGGQQIGRRNRQ
jgi:hypothetical protein